MNRRDRRMQKAQARPPGEISASLKAQLRGFDDALSERAVALLLEGKTIEQICEGIIKEPGVMKAAAGLAHANRGLTSEIMKNAAQRLEKALRATCGAHRAEIGDLTGAAEELGAEIEWLVECVRDLEAFPESTRLDTLPDDTFVQAHTRLLTRYGGEEGYQKRFTAELINRVLADVRAWSAAAGTIGRVAARAHERIRGLRFKQATIVGGEGVAAKTNYEGLVGISHAQFVERCVAAAKDLIFPDPVTANNVEVSAMSTTLLMKRLAADALDKSGGFFELMNAYMAYAPVAAIALKTRRWKVRLELDESRVPKLVAFCLAWARSSYARLEVGHKIAASFCLTDVPDDMAEAPWEAWSLVVPDGLLGDIARVWVVGLEVFAVLRRDGREHKPTKVEGDMIQCLVRSSAMALSEPDEFKKEKKHSPSARKSGGRHGPPDLERAEFLLSTPIEVDLRENVRAALEDERLGRKHASPKVQFLVRGHPRWQAYGEGRALRKKIWIQPFWKGPEGGRVLLRTYKVEEPKE